MKSILSLPLSLLLLFFTGSPFLNAQLSLDWALVQGSKGSDLSGAACIDKEGNIYAVTILRDTTDLDPGPQEDWLIPTTYEVMVLSKFNEDGTYLWGAQFVSEYAKGFVAEIKDDKVIVILEYIDQLVYVLGDTEMTLATLPGKQSCIVQMNKEGQIITVNHFMHSHNMYFSDFITLDDGSYLTAGGFEDTINLAVSGGTNTRISNGGSDAFIARFNSSFEMEWFTVLGGKGDDYLEEIFLHNKESIYYTMVYDSAITLTTDQGLKILPSTGDENGIFGRASLDGSLQTAYSFGGSFDDELRAIRVDEDNNIYICGYFEGEVNFELGGGAPVVFTSVVEGDGFVAKYQQDGSLEWVRIITDTEYGGLYTMTLERGNELYLSGSYTRHADLDPGPDSLIMESDHRGDVYAIKFDTDGNMKWAHAFVGASGEGIVSLLVDDTKVILNGYFGQTLDADYTSGQHIIESHGGQDKFMMGFTEQGVISAVDNQPQPLEIALYPNPSADEIHINCETAIESISLHTMNGALLTVPVNIQNERAQINLRGLTPGMYLVKVKSGDQYSVVKVVKE